MTEGYQHPLVILLIVVIIISGLAYSSGYQLLIRLARQQWQRGQLARVHHLYNLMLLIWPHRPDLMILRGYCLFELGRAPQALKDFEQAVEQNPERAATYRSLGDVYATYEHDFDRAISAFDRAIALDPNVIDVYLVRAKLRVCRQRDFELALNDCNHAIQLAEPEFRKHREFSAYIPHGQAISHYFSQRLVRLYSLRAIIYAQLGEAELEQVDTVSAETLNRIESVLFRANVLMEQKNYAASIDLLQPLAAYTPTRWDIHHLLGSGFYGLGDHDATREAYNRAIDLAPNVAVLYNNRAESELAAGVPANALTDFRAALVRHPTLLHAEAGQAVTQYIIGEIETARTIWRKLLKRDERFADAAWVGKRLNWTPPLIQEAHRLIGEL